MSDGFWKAKNEKLLEEVAKERRKQMLAQARFPTDTSAMFSPFEQWSKFAGRTLLSPFYKTETGRPAVEQWTPEKALAIEGRQRTPWRAPSFAEAYEQQVPSGVRMATEAIAETPLWMGLMGGLPPIRGPKVPKAAKAEVPIKPSVIPTEAATAAETVAPPIAKSVEQEVAINKLLRIVKAEKPALQKTRQLRHAELQKRVAKMATALEKGEPEEALARAAKLRAGKMPIAEVPLREQFAPDEARQLYEVIRSSPLRPLEKTRAFDAFNKLFLTNELLQKNEITLLGEIFGPEFVKPFLTRGQRAVRIALDIANLPRAVLASSDFSATLRQGGILLARRPYLLPGMIKTQLKSFVSGKNLQVIDDIIRADSDFAVFSRLGGYTAPISGRVGALWKAEETFMTRFAHYIPLVQHSERAFIGGLNWLRFNSFKHGYNLFKKMGTTSEEDLRGLINLTNYASGRGSWRFLRGDIGPAVNAVLFSPRLVLSRLQLPTLLFDKSPAVRKEAWRTLIQFLGFGTGILSGLKLAGAEVEIDPRSADFGKAKIGNTRLDIWTGYIQYARFLSQFVTSSRKTTATGRIVETTRLDVIRRFLQSKLSPMAGLIYDILAGQTYLGEELSFETESLRKQAYNRLTPLFFQDMIDAIATDGLMGGIAAIPGVLGVGVVSYREAEPAGRWKKTKEIEPIEPRRLPWEPPIR